jgi:hypothetical protein
VLNVCHFCNLFVINGWLPASMVTMTGGMSLTFKVFFFPLTVLVPKKRKFELYGACVSFSPFLQLFHYPIASFGYFGRKAGIGQIIRSSLQ